MQGPLISGPGESLRTGMCVCDVCVCAYVCVCVCDVCVCLCVSACEMCGHAPLSLLVTLCSAACVFPALEPFPALLSPHLGGEPAAAYSHPDPTHTGEPSHMVYMNTLQTAQRYTHSCTMHKQT